MSHSQVRKTLFAIWICFIVRCAFYSTLLPLWEGFDEWAHFSVLQQMSTSASLIIDRNSRVSRDIDASLDLAPLPRGMTSIPPLGITHDKYWQLNARERADRERALRELPLRWASEYESDAMPAYEASQPPLYYWVMAAGLKLLPQMPLIERLWYVRVLTALLASLVIPIGYFLAKEFFGNKAVALGAMAIVSVAPGLALASSRVSNEGLSIPLFSLVLLAVIFWLRQPRFVLAGVVGALLGLGLLTKAYFLTAVPALWGERSVRPGQHEGIGINSDLMSLDMRQTIANVFASVYVDSCEIFLMLCF
jgi:hypothetical protein